MVILFRVTADAAECLYLPIGRRVCLLLSRQVVSAVYHHDWHIIHRQVI